MICKGCCDDNHEKCQGCMCQHRRLTEEPPETPPTDDKPKAKRAK